MAQSKPPADWSPDIHIEQSIITDGGVGVSIERADTVVQGASARTLRRGLLAVFALGALSGVLTVAVAFATNLAGTQDSLCRIPGMQSVCAAWDLGHLPSPPEQTAWAVALEQGSCEALRTYLASWPTGAFADEAQARLDGARREAETVWTAKTTRFPITVRSGDPFPNEEQARADARQRGVSDAELACAGYQQSQQHQVDGARAEVQRWSCVSIGSTWRCGFDGQAHCDVRIAHTQITEHCSAQQDQESTP